MGQVSIHTLGQKIGCYTAAAIARPEQSATLGYGAEIIIGSLIKICVLFLLALMLQIVMEVAVLLAVTGIVRTFSGGAHCSTYYRCLITSIVVLTASGYFIKVIFPFLHGVPGWVLIIVSSQALLIYWRYSPQAPLNRPIRNEVNRIKFHQLTLILSFALSIISIFLGTDSLVSWLIATGLVWQAFTLTVLGHKLIKLVDGFMITPGWKGGGSACGSR